MSIFHCPKCQHETHIFGHDGARRVAQELETDLLGDIPLHVDICTTSDQGTPITVLKPDGPQAHAYNAIARTLLQKIHTE